MVRDGAGAARGTNWAWIRVGWPWQIFAPQQLFLSPTLSPSTNVSRSKPLLPKRSGIEGNCAVLQNVALIEEEGEGKEGWRGRFWRFLLPLLFLFLALALNVSRFVRLSVAVTDGRLRRSRYCPFPTISSLCCCCSIRLRSRVRDQCIQEPIFSSFPLLE